MIHVTLTPNEVEIAAFVGLSRRMSHIRNPNPSRDKNANGQYTWDYEMEAAIAELAYCKSRKIYWSGISKIAAKDGGNVEIRWASKSHYGLIIYEYDDDESHFVLVDGSLCNKRIIGYMKAKDCKKAEYLKPEGYYIVPREDDVFNLIPPKRKI